MELWSIEGVQKPDFLRLALVRRREENILGHGHFGHFRRRMLSLPMKLAVRYAATWNVPQRVQQSRLFPYDSRRERSSSTCDGWTIIVGKSLMSSFLSPVMDSGHTRTRPKRTAFPGSLFSSFQEWRVLQSVTYYCTVFCGP